MRAISIRQPWAWLIVHGHAFELAGAGPLPFTPYKGGLGFFHVPADAIEGLNVRANRETP